MKRLAVVCCYFGPLPNHIFLALKTMAWNASIDWFIFTDQPQPQRLASNIRFYPLNLDTFQRRVAEVSGTKVKISYPYEVYIFKPTFGEVFSDCLTCYDFWGHCDLDVLWGDIRGFLTEGLFASYDRLLIRGHLSFYRNTPLINQAYKLSVPGALDYRSAFADPLPTGAQFDEWLGMNLIFRYHDLKQFHADFIADIVPPSRFFIPPFQTLSRPNFKHQIFYWHKGKTYRAYLYEGGVLDEELCYIHFQKRHLPKPDPFLVDQTSFGISPRGFFPYKRQAMDQSTFISLNRGYWKSPADFFKVFLRALQKRVRSSFQF